MPERTSFASVNFPEAPWVIAGTQATPRTVTIAKSNLVIDGLTVKRIPNLLEGDENQAFEPQARGIVGGLSVRRRGQEKRGTAGLRPKHRVHTIPNATSQRESPRGRLPLPHIERQSLRKSASCSLRVLLCIRWPTACDLSRCQVLSFEESRSVYLLRPGGKSFSSFCAPLLSLCWFFSCFLLGSIACWATPIQTSFFTAGSYIPTRKVPM